MYIVQLVISEIHIFAIWFQIRHINSYFAIFELMSIKMI